MSPENVRLSVRNSIFKESNDTEKMPNEVGAQILKEFKDNEKTDYDAANDKILK